jgi:hypothetical protein
LVFSVGENKYIVCALAFQLVGNEFKICGVWRSVWLEAVKPTNNLLSSKLTEPRANQQGKRVRVFRKVQVINICSNYSIIDALAP